MKTAILDASVDFIDQPFLKPLRISSGLITNATEARVTVTVQTEGRIGIGHGSIYLSDLWAWPGATPDRSTKDKSMRKLCEAIAGHLYSLCGDEEFHPLELGLRLHHSVTHSTLTPPMPALARAVCVSPFDAALHDAAGNSHGLSAFHFFDSSSPIPSADSYFPDVGAIRAIKNTLRSPQGSLSAWWIVGAGDDLEVDLRPALEKTGIRSLKIKLLGRDSADDAIRTSEIFQAARQWGFSPILSVDSNEGNSDAASVLDYFERLKVLDSAAYDALLYLEQPTSRDILDHPQNWRAVASQKPVMLDEGLTSFDLLPIAREQCWSGLALKTCKGHSFALVSAAWARQNNLLLSLQDLTNPGYSAIHAFLLGAHLATLNGIELNSPQYTPAANQSWLPALSGLFEPRDGIHRFPLLETPGLGSSIVGFPQ